MPKSCQNEISPQPTPNHEVEEKTERLPEPHKHTPKLTKKRKRTPEKQKRESSNPKKQKRERSNPKALSSKDISHRMIFKTLEAETCNLIRKIVMDDFSIGYIDRKAPRPRDKKGKERYDRKRHPEDYKTEASMLASCCIEREMVARKYLIARFKRQSQSGRLEEFERG